MDSIAFAGIEVLAPPATAADVRGLAELLCDAVDSGASVSFTRELTQEEAEAFWRRTLAAGGKTRLLVAREGGDIVGSVLLQPATAPNQPHRATVAKLLVHRRCRGRGLGSALMQAVEAEAEALGFTLLVLDTARGEHGERLYPLLGWQYAGTIPGYSYNPDGVLCDVLYYYKQVGAGT